MRYGCIYGQWIVILIWTCSYAIPGKSGSTPVTRKVEVAEGETAALVCSFSNLQHSLGYSTKVSGAEGVRGILLSWFRLTESNVERLLAEGDRINPWTEDSLNLHVFSPSTPLPFSILVIEAVRPDHTGLYKCATAQDDVLHQVIFLSVRKSILRVAASEKRSDSPNAPVELSCKVTDQYPVALVYWTAQVAKTKEHITWKFKAWGDNVNVTDNGKYQCHVDNFVTPPFVATFDTAPPTVIDAQVPAHLVTAYFNKVPALLAVGGPETRALVGKPYELACLVEGPPQIKVIWRKDGKPVDLAPFSRFSVRTFMWGRKRVMSTLYIRRVVGPQDQAVYSCLSQLNKGAPTTLFEFGVNVSKGKGNKKIELSDDEDVDEKNSRVVVPLPEDTDTEGGSGDRELRLPQQRKGNKHRSKLTRG